MRMYMLQEGPL